MSVTNDFVYAECFKIGNEAGLQQRDAEQIASICLGKYKSNSFKKATDVFDVARKMSKRALRKGFIF